MARAFCLLHSMTENKVSPLANAFSGLKIDFSRIIMFYVYVVSGIGKFPYSKSPPSNSFRPKRSLLGCTYVSIFNKPIRKKKSVSCTKLELGCIYIWISPFVKNKIRFIHKTRIRLYLCFSKPIRKKPNTVDALN